MKKIICLLSFIILSNNLKAQDAILINNSPDSKPEKRIVQIKLISTQMYFDEGIFIYRKEKSSDDWQKVSNTPIKKEEIKKEDISNNMGEVYELYNALMSENPKEENDKNFKKFMMIIEALSNNEFAKLLGIYFEDINVSENNSYVYKITKLESGKEIEIGVSEQITIGDYKKNKQPTTLICEREQSTVLINWEKGDKFFAWNIYKRDSLNTNFIKINDAPVLIFDKQLQNDQKNWNYQDTNISENNTYYYKLAGLDMFGNESDYSQEVIIRILDQTAPESALNLKNEININEVKLSWDYPNIPSDFKGFNIYRSEDLEGQRLKINTEILTSSQKSYIDKVDKIGKVYYYFVESVDINGNGSFSELSVASVTDVLPPSKPKIDKAEGDIGIVRLTFGKQTEEDFWGYKIFRALEPDEEFALLNSEPYDGTEYVDTLQITSQVPYYYKIKAFDSSYNESDYSDIVEVKLKDVTSPFKPFFKSINVSGNEITIEWLPNLDPDLMGYNLLRAEETDTSKWEQLNTKIIDNEIVSYSDKSLIPGIKYLYALVAIDSSNNVSEKSNFYPGLIFDDSFPRQVTDGSAEYQKENNVVKINWTYQGDKNFLGFVIFRREEKNNEYIAVSNLIQENTFNDKMINEGDSYNYIIKTYSKNGNNERSNDYKVDIR